MPIRVTDDNSSNDGFNSDDSGDRGGRRGGNTGGGGLGSFLPLIMGLLFKNPKIGFPLLIGIGLFMYFGKGCSGVSQQSQKESSLSTGCEMKKEIYDKAEQFEKLDGAYNPLPESVTLQEFCPPVGNQGQQGSCVGWSSSYAARSILYNVSTGANPRNLIFSPAFLYNQIGLEGCQGAYIKNAMETLHKVGDISLNEFPYDENDCTRKPGSSLIEEASQFKIKGYNRLSKDANQYEVDILAIKQNLAQGAPVVIGMSVGGTFMEMMGREMWIPSDEDYQKMGFGGHAMCVVGYDDFKEYEGRKIGAFQIMNSWGAEYGKNGFVWVPYKVFEEFVVEAYGLYPMGRANKVAEKNINVSFGVLDVEKKQEFRLKKTNSHQYTTVEKIAPGTKFRLKISNNKECYTYVFGMETDGSSYVLFPYTPKHSPYCGITGTRTFPKDKFLEPDNIGDKDYFGIVVSEKELDFVETSKRLSSSKAATYQEKFDEVFHDKMSKDFRFVDNENIAFSADLNDGSVAFVVVEVIK